MRVLFIDDESSVRDLIAAFCESLDIEYDATCSAEDALQRMAEQNFMLVVTDISMPGMNGIHFAKEVRKRYPQTGIFAFTGTPPSIEDKARAFFDKIFNKPDEYSHMIAEVLKYLAIRKYPFLK